MKNWIALFLVLIILAAGSAFYLYNKKLEDVYQMDSDFRMSSADLYESFSLDEEKANGKYLDKIIEVKGKVIKIEKTESGRNVFLETNDLIGSVIVDTQDEVSNGIVGKEVVLKGICTGFLMDVILVRARILKTNE